MGVEGIALMSLFLTTDELRELTGYQRPSCMIRQLRENGVRFFIAADGYPRVARNEIESRHPSRQSMEPDFSSLQKIEKRV